MNLLKFILDILYPVNCILCGKNGFDLCLNCLMDSPSPERESPSWIYPLFDYRHPPIRKSIWLLKYKGKKRLAIIFAEVLYGRIIEEISDLKILKNFKNPLLIPIPLSKRRYNERGYNQAELICKELIKIDKKAHLRYSVNVPRGENMNYEKKILIKTKETEHQVKAKNRNERLNNLCGSFFVKNKDFIKDRDIILIDDVLTTGATLSEARKVLREAGARKIIAFTIAH